MDEITLEGDAQDRLLVLRGEVTVENAPALKDAVVEATRDGGTLVICAVGLTRLDAAGLQVLIAGARAARRAVLRGAAPPAWLAAFSRYAVEDPFDHESPC